MKKCPYCAEDIQDDASVCKHCGRTLKAKTGWVTWAATAFFALVLLGWCSSQFNPPGPPDVTLAEFNSIDTGMTYEQVVAIIGKPGAVASRSDLAGTVTIMYQWTADRGLGNMNAMFQNGRLITKAQFGLE